MEGNLKVVDDLEYEGEVISRSRVWVIPRSRASKRAWATFNYKIEGERKGVDSLDVEGNLEYENEGMGHL